VLRWNVTFETKTETIVNILKYCEPKTEVRILLVIACYFPALYIKVAMYQFYYFVTLRNL